MEINGTPKWTIGPAAPAHIERLEDAFNAHARKADEAPHLWGEEQEAELTRLAVELRAAYDAEGTDEFDRIV